MSRHQVDLTGNVTMHEGSDRFMGMTKIQFMFVLMLLVLLSIISTAGNIIWNVQVNKDRIAEIDANQAKIDALLEQSAEDHLGICGLIDNIDSRVDLNRKILMENPGQQITLGGLTFDRVLLEDSVARDGAALNALRPVDCTDVPQP